jgi:hypothetical protein
MIIYPSDGAAIYVQKVCWNIQHEGDYSFALDWSIASATLRRWIFPVAVFGICVTIQTCCMALDHRPGRYVGHKGFGIPASGS